MKVVATALTSVVLTDICSVQLQVVKKVVKMVAY